MNDVPLEAPLNPAGPTPEPAPFSVALHQAGMAQLGSAAEALRAAVAGLNESQLDTRYRNWTLRQITHHVADSHCHAYLRFKWAMTESCPTIKAYNEADWVQQPDAMSGGVEPSLAMVDGIHRRWVLMLQSMTEADFERTFFHPESKRDVPLWEAFQYYPWHARHHTAQIQWVRQRNNW